MRRLIAALVLGTSALISTGVLAASAGAATVTLPTVNGAFGATPTVTFPNTTAPTTLQSKVLSAGQGQVIAKGELLAVNYLGQIWRGKIFDSSFSRKEAFGTPIGVGAVVQGWDQGLVGKRVGSRVLLVIPPSLGYGAAGNSGAGIKGTDTIVFVVDLLAVYSKTVGDGMPATILSRSAHGVSVGNIVSTSPTLSISKTAKKPTAESVDILARGSGAKVVPGLVILQFVVDNWSAKVIESTWKLGSPAGQYIGSKLQASVFDKLVGDRIGSRVLIELPANSNGGPYVLEAQIAAELPAKATA